MDPFQYGGWHAAFLDVDSLYPEQAANDKLVATAVLTISAMPGLTAAKIRINPTFFIAGFTDETLSRFLHHFAFRQTARNSGGNSDIQQSRV